MAQRNGALEKKINSLPDLSGDARGNLKRIERIVEGEYQMRELHDIENESVLDSFQQVCANCGLTKGSHHGGIFPWPYNYCPGHEGRMDWDNSPGTVFKPSGRYTEDPPLKRI
jgi:hypothetical protein